MMRFASLARRSALPAALLAAAACVSTGPRQPQPAAPPAPVDTARPPAAADTLAPEPLPDISAPPEQQLGILGRVVRIAIATSAPRVTLSGSGAWRLYDSGGESTLLRGDGGDLWTIEQHGGLMRAVNDDGVATAERPAPLVARPASRDALVIVNGHRYRGEVWVYPGDRGLTIVNRLYLEDYLRGVVPLEIGRRAPGEEDAVAAQAIAARSYAYTHLSHSGTRPYDMVSTVYDQVYGGADAEDPIADSAVAATRGLVLMYHGVVVNAPYHSTCGGSTAAASEVWPDAGDEPYLKPVSDRIPGTDRYYCDIAPRFRWERTFSRADLRELLDRYLAEYTAVPARGPGSPRAVKVDGHTRSGRVRAVVFTTSRGRYAVRGDRIRFVLRSAGGEILNSTYFSIDNERGSDGAIARLVVRGRGYGHGVGMCQWGAIGRARAGQDFRTILRTYYPGTVVAAVGPG